MLHQRLKDTYKDAVRLTQKGGEEQPVAAAMVVLAQVLEALPAQTFDINVTLGDNPVSIRVGGDDPRYCDPVSVAVESE